MNKFKRLSGICALLSIVCALAGGVFLSLGASAAPTQSVAKQWDIPTAYVDGTPLPVSAIAGYKLTYSIDGGTPVIVNVTGGAKTTTTLALNLAVRATPYVLSSVIRTVLVNGAESVDSSPAQVKNITVLSPSPNAPSNFKITITCDAGSCNLLVN